MNIRLDIAGKENTDPDPQQRQPLLRCLLLDPSPSINPSISSIIRHINI
jgi:hypothetical protein